MVAIIPAPLVLGSAPFLSGGSRGPRRQTVRVARRRGAHVRESRGRRLPARRHVPTYVLQARALVYVIFRPRPVLAVGRRDLGGRGRIRSDDGGH